MPCSSALASTAGRESAVDYPNVTSAANRAECVRPLQAILIRLRRLAEEAFPNARAFVRAGFDEPLPPLHN